jgi:hypothetical protein
VKEEVHMLIFHPFSWLSNFKHGWDEPVPGWVTRAGYDLGHMVLPELIVVAIIFFAVLAVIRR